MKLSSSWNVFVTPGSPLSSLFGNKKLDLAFNNVKPKD